MKLTRTQLNYAESRLADKKNELVEAINAKYPCIEQPSLTFADMYAQIKAGKAKLKPIADLRSYTDLVDAYDYPTQTAAFAKWEKEAQAVADKREAEYAKLNKQAQTILDKLYLGDAEVALRLIDSLS